MTADEVKRLVESAVGAAVGAMTAQVSGLRERAMRGDAYQEGRKVLATMTFTESARAKILDDVMRFPLPEKDGALDVAKFTEAVTEEAKRMGVILSEAGGGRVTGFGPSAPVLTMSEADRATAAAKRKLDLEEAEREDKAAEEIFTRLLGTSGAGKKAAMKGAA